MKINGNVPAVPQGYVKAMEQKKAKLGDNENAMKNWGKKLDYLPPEDQLTISFLQGETEANEQRLKEIVKDMLRRQGVAVDKLEHLQTEDLDGVVIDEEARAEAAYMIGPDGPLSIENTADRIFKFAQAISGGDDSKIANLRDAVVAGFDQVKGMIGELPDISEKTYDLIMAKFDAWENGEEIPMSLEPVDEPAPQDTEEPEPVILDVPPDGSSIVEDMLGTDDEEEELSIVEQMLAEQPEDVEEEETEEV